MTRYEKFLKEYDFFSERAKELASYKMKLSTEKLFLILDVFFMKDKIEVECSNMIDDSFRYSFSYNDFTVGFKKYKNDLLKLIKEKEKNDKRIEEIKKENKKSQKEKREKTLYLNLKSKYE